MSRPPIEDGWWYRASKEQRLAQIDAAIELGLTAVVVAKNCGVRTHNQVSAFALEHGRKFSARSGRGGKAQGARKSRRAAYFHGEAVDFWRDGVQDRSLRQNGEPEEDHPRMNQSQQIARPCPRARAIGRREANPSLSLSASAIIDHQHQTWTDTERGLAREVMCPSAPAVGRWGLQSGFFPSVTMSSLQSTGRGFGLGSFGLRGRVNARLANYVNPAEYPFHNAVQPFECHSEISDCYVQKRSNSGGQTIGQRGQNERSHCA